MFSIQTVSGKIMISTLKLILILTGGILLELACIILARGSIKRAFYIVLAILFVFLLASSLLIGAAAVLAVSTDFGDARTSEVCNYDYSDVSDYNNGEDDDNIDSYEYYEKISCEDRTMINTYLSEIEELAITGGFY